MDLPIKLALKRPVTIGDQTYGELEFEEPDIASQIAFAELTAELNAKAQAHADELGITVSAAERADPEEVEASPALQIYLARRSADGARVMQFWIGRLANVPEEVAGKIKATDMAAVSDVVSQILEISQEDEAVGEMGNATAAK